MRKLEFDDDLKNIIYASLTTHILAHNSHNRVALTAFMYADFFQYL